MCVDSQGRTNETVLIAGAIPPELWGKDHWSLLGYVATRFDGDLKHQNLRCNIAKHPLLVGHPGQRWQDSYSTRLKNGQALGHDDWDCLDDLEAAGLVNIISLVNGIVFLTAKGNTVVFALRKHKESGGVFHTFEMPANVEV